MKFFINILLFSIFISTVTVSCTSTTKDFYLDNGLEKYRKSRNVNQEFVKGYGINKIAFFEIDQDNITVVLKLNDQTDQQMLDNYSLGAYVFKDNKYTGVLDGKLDWNTKPELTVIHQYKYIIDTIAIPREMDSLVFYLYERDKYRKIIGDRIVLKNISI